MSTAEALKDLPAGQKLQLIEELWRQLSQQTDSTA